MSFEERLLVGTAQAVAADPSPLTFKMDLKYVDGEFGIFFTADTDQRDRAMVIRTYAVEDSPADNDATIGLQFEIRSPSLREVLDIVDLLRALLHRAWGVTLGDVEVSQAFRRSGTGSDSGGRVSYTENYYLTVNRS
jgi:hypothetical protein